MLMEDSSEKYKFFFFYSYHILNYPYQNTADFPMCFRLKGLFIIFLLADF